MFSHRRLWSALLVGTSICLLVTSVKPQATMRPITVAVLDFADTGIGKTASEKFARNLASSATVAVIDRDLVRAAARGAAYTGSLNLLIAEARDLGAAIGCDFYIIGDAQTVRRSPSTGPGYFESYASIFLVSSRTGKLISWERPSFEAPT